MKKTTLLKRHKNLPPFILWKGLIVVGLFISSPILFAQSGWQKDSTVTITPEGDTIISYKLKDIDFGQNVICSYAEKKTLTEKEKEKIYKQNREDKKAAHLRQLEALREKRASEPSRSGSYSVGEIPLSSGVSPSGARTYQIPIPTAPGIPFSPTVSLVYNSQGGDGAAGYGWDIAGVPAICLINQNVYYHGQAKAANVNNTIDPVFALDGVPIVENDDPATSQNYPFATARGHILVSRQLNNQGYIKSFTVLYPDGNKGVFGSVVNDLDSNLPSYPLVRLENSQQDSIVFRYLPGLFHFERILTSIRYGHDSSGSPSATIEFTSQSSINYVRKFFAGLDVSCWETISSIESRFGTSVLSRYDLTHEVRDNVRLLTRVDCSSGGEQIPPLTFTYMAQAMLPEYPDTLIVDSTKRVWSSYPSQVGVHTKRGKFIRGRFEDGILSYPYGSTYDAVKKVLWNRKYGSPYPEDQPILVAALLQDISLVDNTILSGAGFQTVECVDVDGDGADEIVRVNFGESSATRSPLNLSVYKVNPYGSPVLQYSFTVQLQGVITEGNFHSPYRRQYFWGDYDGDGKVELLTIAHDKNSHDKAQTCYAALIDIDGRQLLSEDVLFTFTKEDDEIGNIFTFDYDGDSRTELCQIMSSGLRVYRLGNNGHFTLGGSYSNVYLYTSTLPRFTTDLNGDGYLDLLNPPAWGGDVWNVYVFNGNSFEILSFHLTDYDSEANYLFIDVNRDGLSDLVKVHESTTDIFLNKTGFEFDSAHTSRGILSGTNGIAVANVADPSGMSAFIKLDGLDLKVYTWPNSSQEIRSVYYSEDSHSRVTFNDYTYLPGKSGCWSDNITVDNSAGFIQRSIPIHVLQQEISNQSLSGSEYVWMDYEYRDPVVHSFGLGFCGFSHIRTYDNLGGPPERVTETFYDPQRMGIVTEERHKVGVLSSPWSTTTYTYDDHSTPHGKLSPRLTRTVSTDSRTGIGTDIIYGPYDNYDFPLQVLTQKYVTPDTVATYEILYRTYLHSTSPSKYVLGVVTEESVVRERDGDACYSWKERDTTSYDSLLRPVRRRHLVGEYNYATDTVAYDPTGLRARIRAARQARRETLREVIDSVTIEILDADSLVSETRWTYDAHGNVISEKTAPHGASVFTGDTLVYDSLGRNLLSKTDGLGRTISFSNYDKFGNPASSTDHKGRTTSYTYDAWGRLIQTILPDGTVEATSTAWGGSGLYTVTRTVTGAPESITHYDALGREIRGGVKRFDGQWQYMDKEYDARGRLYRVSLPYRGASPSLWNVYVYDDYDRPTSITEASGKVSTWSYSGRSTTMFKEGITSTSTTDAFGAVYEVEDGGGTILYGLRDDGQPYLITAPGEVSTTFAYDGFGRQIEISDPSAGTRTEQWTWNPDGSSTVVRTNPNGSVTTHADRFGRTTLVERSGGHSTAYTYGSDGLLQSMISSNGADRVYTYDAYDRVATATDSVACFVGTRWIRKTFTYGAGSVVSSIKYTSPDGDITTETYTYANGHNTGITLPDNTKVWSLVSENDLGAPTQIQSGQVTREYGYTATGLPTYRKMGNPFNGGLGALQHFTYQFDPQTGNLMSRADVNHNQAETFTYDALDRLSSINGRTITYDNAKGNITAIGGVGTMTYGNSLHPYRITGMTPVADSLISFGTQRITYTSFDRPATINEGADSVTFSYGCDGERVSMNGLVTNGIFVSTYATDYIGDRYECKWDDSIEPIREILYLGGDAYSAPMVYVKQGYGNWTLYNIGRDYLGNITQIAYANGLPFAEYSYDPWGRLRDPQTLSIYGRGHEPTLFLDRGFTGHEHLPQFGLINMNARLYDPLVGRFLSPDPFVQDPGFSQNYNRYSYALNNPLKYSDESGEIFFWSFNGKTLELGCSFLFFEVGISYTFGTKEDQSLGFFVGIGFRTGSFFYELSASARITIEYKLYSREATFSSQLQATASLGDFRANAAITYSMLLDQTRKESVSASLGLSYNRFKNINLSSSYKYSRDFDEDYGEHKLSMGLDSPIYLKTLKTGLALGVEASMTFKKNEDIKYTLDFTSLAMPQNEPSRKGLNADYIYNKVQPLKKSFGGMNNKTLKSFYELEFRSIIDQLERNRDKSSHKK